MTGHKSAQPNRAALWITGSFITGVLLALAGVALSGAAQERLIADPGAATRWGLPAVLAVHHLALAGVVGALIFAAVIVPRRVRFHRGSRPDAAARSIEHPAFARALMVASVAAVVWVPAALVVLLLTYADIAGAPLSAEPGFTAQLQMFVTDIAAGQARAVILIIAVLVSMLVFLVRSSLGLILLAGLSLASIVPATAAIGHAAGSTDHIGASSALGLHVAAATVWAGGIIVLAALIPALTVDLAPDPANPKRHSPDTAKIMRRFSGLAGVAFVMVVATGTLSSLYRLEDIENLFSPYGILLLSKTAITLLLGLLGLLHRRRTIPRLAPTGQSVLLWRIIVVELLLMGAAAGLAVALSRSPSPVPLEPDPTATPAQLLTGYLLPPAPGNYAWLLQWRPDWLWITVAILAALAYAWAYASIRRKPVSWPALRPLSWYSALILLTFLTSGPPAVYGPVMLSAHATGSMTLALAVPALLLAGKPLHLGYNVTSARTDGSVGPQEIIRSITDTVRKPGPLLYGLALGSLTILFYLTPAFALALSDHVAHETALLLFLTVGLLFGHSAYSHETPGSRRARVSGVSAALIGIAAVGFRFLRPAVIEQDWFTGLGRAWGPTTAADQHNAGIILACACILTAGILVSSQLRTQPIPHHGLHIKRQSDARTTPSKGRSSEKAGGRH